MAVLALTLSGPADAQDFESTGNAGFISILPALIAIGSALLFRQVIPALFLGVWFGAIAVLGLAPANIWIGLLQTVEIYVVEAMADSDHVAIIVFSFLIGGTVGIITKSGGMTGIVEHIVKFTTTPRRAQLGTAGMGLAIFFDDYTNSLVVGNTMRSVTDRLNVSREKLAYIVDSTAAPVACLALVTTWIGYQVGLIDSSIQNIPQLQEPYAIFLNSLKYSFYPILAIIFVLMISWSGRDYGPMLTAERNARAGNRTESDADRSLSEELSEVQPKPGVGGHAINAVLPIAVLIVAVMAGLWVTGREGAEDPRSLQDIIGNADSYRSLLWGSSLGIMTAALLAIGRRQLTIDETIMAMMGGIRMMFMAMVVLILAWSLQSVSDSLGTADYLVMLFGDAVPAPVLPAIVFVLSAATAFATGTSWGTMGILMPLAVPLSWAIITSGGEGVPELAILYSTVSAVLAGAVWGDHCSPISDTTILSSMASGCNHIEHVRTQLPYALTVGAVAIIAGTLPAGFGMPWWLGLVVGAIILAYILRTTGKRVEE